ncbi:hypothetical protein HS125_18170 [bacterium]|nr:hypothetical protein [bacterium]
MTQVGPLFPRRCGALLVLALASLLVSAQAAPTVLWEVDTRADFEAGQPQGVRIADPGRVSLSRATQTPKDAAKTLSDPLVWSLARDEAGNLFLGTGNDGRIHRWGNDGKLELLADLDAAEIYALAVDKSGRLFAGASPSGIIYQIDEKGRTSIYHKTGATYIWAMAFDAQGRLVLATGKPAQVLRLAGPDKVEKLLTSAEAHIISLLVGRKGVIYAGSVGEGLIYEISPEGGHAFSGTARRMKSARSPRDRRAPCSWPVPRKSRSRPAPPASPPRPRARPGSTRPVASTASPPRATSPSGGRVPTPSSSPWSPTARPASS